MHIPNWIKSQSVCSPIGSESNCVYTFLDRLAGIPQLRENIFNNSSDDFKFESDLQFCCAHLRQVYYIEEVNYLLS